LGNEQIDPRRRSREFFEDTVRRLKAERGDDDPLTIANEAFAAVHARYGDLSEAEAMEAAKIRWFNAHAARITRH
jgi:hypothetical protein